MLAVVRVSCCVLSFIAFLEGFAFFPFDFFLPFSRAVSCSMLLSSASARVDIDPRHRWTGTDLFAHTMQIIGATCVPFLAAQSNTRHAPCIPFTESACHVRTETEMFLDCNADIYVAVQRELAIGHPITNIP